MSNKTKTFNGVEYERWVYPNDLTPTWSPVEHSPHPFLCGVCENKTFEVFSPAPYTTSVRCTKCGTTDEVHTG